MDRDSVTPAWVEMMIDRTGMRKAAIADILGIDPSLFSRVLKGKRKIKPDEAEALIKIFADAHEEIRYFIAVDSRVENPDSATTIIRLLGEDGAVFSIGMQSFAASKLGKQLYSPIDGRVPLSEKAADALKSKIKPWRRQFE